ncbi:MAG: hypothetical protein MAG715_01326 [Methanonatronarchaeales archaeon]|nr:hypothetical protein [Methanonatronarchaeales archaeon]
MKILAFSDWRVQNLDHLLYVLDAVNVDLVLYGGDDLSRFINEDANYFEEIARRTSKELFLGVAGNDDLQPLNQIYSSKNVIDLHQRPLVEDEIGFLGQEGTVEPGPGNILYSERTIRDHIKAQKEEIPNTASTILLTHVPPKGTLSTGARFGFDDIGSEAIRSINDLDLIVCGHSHSSGGKYLERANHIVLNVASHDHEGADGRFAIVDVDESGINSIKTTSVRDFFSRISPLSRLTQVGIKRVLHMKEHGIDSLNDINENNRESLLKLPGAGKWHVDRWIQESRAVIEGRILLTEELLSTISRIERPIFYDIETDLGGNQIWL